MASWSADGGSGHGLEVAGISNQGACDVDGDGDGQELLKLADASELAEHDLAENELARCGAQRHRKRVEEHGEGKRDEQEELDRELNNAYLDGRDELGNERGEAVERHAEDEDHQLVRLGALRNRSCHGIPLSFCAGESALVRGTWRRARRAARGIASDSPA